MASLISGRESRRSSKELGTPLVLHSACIFMLKSQEGVKISNLLPTEPQSEAEGVCTMVGVLNVDFTFLNHGVPCKPIVVLKFCTCD